MDEEKMPAALLKRFTRVTRGRDGKAGTRPLRADEVLRWRESDDEVVVVTTDGQKLRTGKG